MNKKKAGQPDNAFKLTAGRATVLRQLWAGTADREALSMAANWIRDIWTAEQSNPTPITEELYRALLDGSMTDHARQQKVARWLAVRCDITLLDNTPISINEARQREGLMPIGETNANSFQPGGDHYMKKKIQHWDFVVSNNHSYLGGQVSKYLTRQADKGGALDVRKASHYLLKMIESHDQAQDEDIAPISLEAFLDAQNLGAAERTIITLVHAYEQSGDKSFLVLARKAADLLVWGLEAADEQPPGAPAPMAPPDA